MCVISGFVGNMVELTMAECGGINFYLGITLLVVSLYRDDDEGVNLFLRIRV